MIFDLTENYVPKAYVDSRDYRVFLRELGMLTTTFKYNIDHFPDLYDPETCPDHLLPLLAGMVGYTYNDAKTVNSNRKIIKSFPALLRNRGSELGIKLAVILCLNTTPGNVVAFPMSTIVVSTDLETGLITIYYPNAKVLDWSLIEVVRPVGMHYKLVPSDFGFNTEEFDVKVTARAITKNQYYDESKVDASQVNFDTTKNIRKQSKK